MRAVMRRLSRVVLVAVLGLLALGVILIALLAWRLSTGPLSVGILTPYLSVALAQSLPNNHRVDLQNTDLMWDVEAKRIVLSARAVTLQEPDGQALAVLPTVEVGLSVPALLRGVVAVSTLRITGAECRLIRRSNGEIQFGHGARTVRPVVSGLGFHELAKGLAEWVDQMSTAPHAALAHLRQVWVKDSTFTVDDQQLGTTWETPPIVLGFTRPSTSVMPRLQLLVDLPGSPMTIDVALSVDSETHRPKIETSFASLRPSALSEVAPFLTLLAPYNVPLKGSVDVSFPS